MSRDENEKWVFRWGGLREKPIDGKADFLKNSWILAFKKTVRDWKGRICDEWWAKISGGFFCREVRANDPSTDYPVHDNSPTSRIIFVKSRRREEGRNVALCRLLDFSPFWVGLNCICS